MITNHLDMYDVKYISLAKYQHNITYIRRSINSDYGYYGCT